MKTGLVTKNERFFMVVALLVGAGFFTVLKNINFKPSSSSFEAVEAINYNMARPEQGYSGYSLAGREIDAQYEAIKAKVKAEKKMADLAKFKAVNTKNKKEANKATTQNTVAKAKQGSHDPFAGQNISKTQNAGAKASQAESASSSPSVNSYAQPTQAVVAASTPAANSSAADTAKEKNKNTKTYAQWRAEIFASPTKETMALFIAAYRKNEVTETEYQAMAQDLIDQNNAALKGLGLMALRSQPSLNSLSQMVHAESTLTADLQAYVQAGYLSYFQAQNVQYLNAALKTSDTTLVTKTLSLLTTNLQKIKSGDTSGFVSSRNIRDAASSGVTIANFATLLPALSTIASAQSNLSGTAQQIANLIQANSNSTVASN